MPYPGEPHWPVRILAPGELSCHTTFPVFRLTAMKLGAAGFLTIPVLLLAPWPVTTKTRSPATSGDEADAWLGETPSTPSRSSVQIDAPSSAFRQTSSARLLT